MGVSVCGWNDGSAVGRRVNRFKINIFIPENENV